MSNAETKCPDCGGLPGLYPEHRCPTCYVKRQQEMNSTQNGHRAKVGEALEPLGDDIVVSKSGDWYSLRDEAITHLDAAYLATILALLPEKKEVRLLGGTNPWSVPYENDTAAYNDGFNTAISQITTALTRELGEGKHE